MAYAQDPATQDPAKATDEPEAPVEVQRAGDGLDLDDIETLVGAMIDEARAYVDEELDPIRKKNQDYYNAELFGNEEENRSQVVMSTVRDAVLAMMPDMMRVFFSSERVVQYDPRGPEDHELAEQATEYARFIVGSDNKGYRIVWDTIMDALIKLCGVTKSWFEYTTKTEAREMTGLSEQDLDVLLSDDDVELEVLATREGPLYDVKVTRTVREGRERLASVPPEEIAWNRGATDQDNCTIIVHTRWDARLDELVGLGYDREEIIANCGAAPDHPNGGEGLRNARRVDDGTNSDLDDERDPETRPIRFDEAYVLLAVKPENGVQMHKVCMIGDHHYLLRDHADEPVIPVSHDPFAFWVAIPEPHAIVGKNDLAALTRDLQEIDSAVMRGILDSLSLSLFPRTEAVESKVNLQDLMNTEIGAIVRTEAPGMVREIRHTFVGMDGLAVLDKTADIKENRTGISKAAVGLDADALQSSTKAGVAATITGAQARKEVIARTLAETGYARTMKNILLDLVENQDQKRIVRLRGKYVPIDPRAWDVNMDVRVNVGLGTGMIEDRLNVMQGVLGKQEQFIDKYGPVNPVCSLSQMIRTLNRTLELAGLPAPEGEFFKPLSDEDEQKIAEAASKSSAPPPDPAAAAIAQAELTKAQAEVQRMQAQIQIDQQKLKLEERKMQMEDDRAKDQLAADTVLKMKELQLKYSTSIDRAEIDADVARERHALDAKVKLQIARETGGDDGTQQP